MNEMVAPESTRTRERGRGAAYVFDALRDEIISLRLAPGTVLSRMELQDRFGLSSTPIRDALMRLHEEGLVDVFPQHATVVTPIDLGRARQAQFLRRSVELELVRTLAERADDELIEKLRSLVRQQVAFANLREHEAFNNADLSFHWTMYEAAGIGDLWNLVRRQAAHIDRLRRLNLPVEGKMKSIVKEHTAIVDAIASKKPDDAQDALRDHLSHSLEFADKMKAQHPEYFAR
jgi:GntR family transcriptional regulator, rspAB operon transcriptional repressor